MFGICSVPFIAGAITTVQSVLQFDGGIRRTIITMITYICADYRDSAYIHQSDRTLCVGRFPYYRGRGVFGHWGYFYDAGIQSHSVARSGTIQSISEFRAAVWNTNGILKRKFETLIWDRSPEETCSRVSVQYINHCKKNATAVELL